MPLCSSAGPPHRAPRTVAPAAHICPLVSWISGLVLRGSPSGCWQSRCPRLAASPPPRLSLCGLLPGCMSVSKSPLLMRTPVPWWMRVHPLQYKSLTSFSKSRTFRPSPSSVFENDICLLFRRLGQLSYRISQVWICRIVPFGVVYKY